MKGIIRSKGLKLVCFILAAITLPMTICAAIVCGYCIDRGFIVTNELRIEGEDLSFREKALENIAKSTRVDVLNEMYNCLLYSTLGQYSDYLDMYSEENSNYFFSFKPVDEKYPTMQNYYNKDYQYKNTGKVTTEYYENKQYFYPCSSDEIALQWIENFKEQYDDKFYESFSLSKEEIKKNMDVRVDMDGVLRVSVDKYTYYMDLRQDSVLIEELKEFEDELRTDGWIAERYADYDMSEEKIIYNYMVGTDVELEYTEYVKRDLAAHDDFYYSPFLRYGDYIEKNTIPVLIGGGVVLLLSSVLLCLSAGRRKDTENIVCGRPEKIPFEIFIFLYITAAVLMAASIHEASQKNGLYILMLISAAAMAGIMMIMYPALLLTIAVRIKARIFIKSTLIYKVFRPVKRGILYLWRNIHIYGKFLIVYAVIIVIKSILISIATVFEVDSLARLSPEPQLWAVVWTSDIIFGLIIIIAIINMNRLKKGAEEISGGNTEYKIDTSHMLPSFRQHGQTLNNIGDGIQAAVEERIKSERMKTELITNVSHDIKTPITSIISYVDLLDKEGLENETAKEYIEVLKRQSERLKKLVQDLIDASKASTGNMPVNIEQVNINVLVEQIIGEFMEKLLSRNIKPVIKYGSESAIAIADGRLLQRCFDNLIQNIYKYAMEDSRAYIDIEESASCISVTLKNISKNELNVSGDELMERFVRGDSSRNTEGSGLGLSIAKSLMEIQGGSLNVVIDGDLFKAVVVVRKQ